VTLNISNYDINPLLLRLMRRFKHSVSFPHTRRIAKENFQTPLFLIVFISFMRNFHFFQYSITPLFCFLLYHIEAFGDIKKKPKILKLY